MFFSVYGVETAVCLGTTAETVVWNHLWLQRVHEVLEFIKSLCPLWPDVASMTIFITWRFARTEY